MAENLAVGSAVGLTATSTDPEGEAVTYFFKDSQGQAVATLGNFTINAATGVVTLASALDYEGATSHTLRIFASDGTVESSTTFTVTVTNVVEQLFTGGADIVDFNAVAPGGFDPGTQYDAFGGNDEVILPDLETVGAGLAWDFDRTFSAGAGNDVVEGGSGDDTIDGSDGDDILAGGEGDDFLAGGAGIDGAAYVGAAAGVRVNLGLTTAQDTGGAGVDTLSGIEDLYGSGFGDDLIGSAADNRLLGLGGDDALSGGGGNDFLDGGTGADAMSGGGGDDMYIVATRPTRSRS